jgi:glycerol uptake facilitator-like aquaporin
VMVFGPLTGAGFNPARSFGPALVGHEFDGAGKFLLVYVVGPLVGALVAAFLYGVLIETPGKREPGGAEPVG